MTRWCKLTTLLSQSHGAYATWLSSPQGRVGRDLCIYNGIACFCSSPILGDKSLRMGIAERFSLRTSSLRKLLVTWLMDTTPLGVGLHRDTTKVSQLFSSKLSKGSAWNSSSYTIYMSASWFTRQWIHLPWTWGWQDFKSRKPCCRVFLS